MDRGVVELLDSCWVVRVDSEICCHCLQCGLVLQKNWLHQCSFLRRWRCGSCGVVSPLTVGLGGPRLLLRCSLKKSSWLASCGCCKALARASLYSSKDCCDMLAGWSYGATLGKKLAKRAPCTWSAEMPSREKKRLQNARLNPGRRTLTAKHAVHNTLPYSQI